MIATNKGIYLWEKGGKIKAHFSGWSEGANFIPATNIRHIYRDDHGVIWLASSQGLVRWEPESQNTRLYNSEDGLFNSNLHAVIEDRHGFLWMSSNNGIIQFHKSSKLSRHFTQVDGITNDEFNRISHERDSAGYIYFGSLNGITRFNPDDFVFDPKNLPSKDIYLTSIQIFSKSEQSHISKLDAFVDGKRVIIRPGEFNFSTSIAINDFDIGSGLDYSYRLSNQAENPWIRMESSVLQIQSLPYGNYDIEIRVKDLNLGFREALIKIPIKVLQPIYLRPWFIVSFVFALIATVIFMAIRAVKIKEKQNRFLEDMIAKSVATIAADKKTIEIQAGHLARKNLEKDRFFANISHEFRTPISLILGPAEMLKTRFPLSSNAKLLLGLIQKNASQLLKLVNDILMLSKLEYGTLTLNNSTFIFREFVEEITREFEELFAQKNIQLVKNYTFDDSQEILQDERILTLIFQNLLSNAFKYTNSNGKVVLDIKILDSQLELRIRDNGIGIHPNDLPYIFDRYYQSERKETFVEGGTGIGLSLVKEVITLVGGEIHVESEWGKGSVFTLNLPVSFPIVTMETALDLESKTFQNSVPTLSEAERRLVQGYPILLVEDNPDFRFFIKHAIGSQYDIKMASNGLDALDILKNGLQPALIVTDLMMPEGNGMDFIRRVKAHPNWHSIPILVQTARANEEIQAEAFSLGIDDYIVKPSGLDQLNAAVSHLIKKYLVQKQLRDKSQEANIRDEDAIAWVMQLKSVVEANFHDPDFSVNQLASSMLMGRTAFFNQVRRLTGLTPNQFILEARLQQARKLFLQHPDRSILEVVRMVGLRHKSHFIGVFEKRFGYTPGQLKN